MLSRHIRKKLPKGLLYYFGTLSTFLCLSSPKTNLIALLGLLKFTLWPRVLFIRYNFTTRKFYRPFTKADRLLFSITSVSFFLHTFSSFHWLYENVVQASPEQKAATWKQVMMTYFTFLYWSVFAGQLWTSFLINDFIVLGNFLIKTEFYFIRKGFFKHNFTSLNLLAILMRKFLF